jgi:lipopolysaccharide biosynthesis glycosyltransferase
MIPIFVGHDVRESAVFHVLQESLMDTASEPFTICPLDLRQLGRFDGQQDGTNQFIYSRFLVPELMDYKGWAIYMDSDMMFRKDIWDLWNLRDDKYAVMCVKHDYKTTATKKFVGTPIEADNESYPRKNWSSLIMWNCGHPKNRIVTRHFAETSGGKVLHRFAWLEDEEIGELPSEWNHLVGEYGYRSDAANTHFTLGAPGFQGYYQSDYSEEWHQYLLLSNQMIGEEPDKMLYRAKHGRHLHSVRSNDV